ncbi:hypothetical protein HRI_002647600 [Hibiscus trionum]|uniref:Uncharacterized protein n=1 Tax=Hibiscus trionum TaxID=183268 RepID=A0A9W7I8A5_HIBTR|nr:hypothetical protein HRI_002647600 [Hibiscus trionum]
MVKRRIELNEFGIEFIPRHAIKAQVQAEFIVHSPHLLIKFMLKHMQALPLPHSRTKSVKKRTQHIPLETANRLFLSTGLLGKTVPELESYCGTPWDKNGSAISLWALMHLTTLRNTKH